jgi:hypothetical protein
MSVSHDTYYRAAHPADRLDLSLNYDINDRSRVQRLDEHHRDARRAGLHLGRNGAAG